MASRDSQEMKFYFSIATEAIDLGPALVAPCIAHILLRHLLLPPSSPTTTCNHSALRLQIYDRNRRKQKANPNPRHCTPCCWRSTAWWTRISLHPTRLMNHTLGGRSCRDAGDSEPQGGASPGHMGQRVPEDALSMMRPQTLTSDPERPHWLTDPIEAL